MLYNFPTPSEYPGRAMQSYRETNTIQPGGNYTSLPRGRERTLYGTEIHQYICHWSGEKVCLRAVKDGIGSIVAPNSWFPQCISWLCGLCARGSGFEPVFGNTEIKDLALQLICKYRIMSFENSSLVWVCSQKKFCSLCILGQHKWQMSQSLIQSLLFWTCRRIIKLECLCSPEIN